MPESSRKTTRAAVEVENLRVTFGNDDVLHHVSFTVEEGDIAAIIGPNGSGKTTLIKSILGLVKIQEGTIRIFEKPLHESRNRIGYVPQVFNFDRQFPITVREFLQLALHKEEGEKRIQRVLHDVGLKHSILKNTLGILSGGQLQRVMIAQAIINNPDLLILDEPGTGIDIVGEAAFYDVVKHLNEDHGTTVILISHDVSMISQKVNQVICINKKLLCSGPPKKALTKKTLEHLFGESGVYEHTHGPNHRH